MAGGKRNRDWVAEFQPESLAHRRALKRVGVIDERSYLQHESELPHDLRLALGRFRFRCLLKNRSDAVDVARCMPPWIRNMQIAKLPFTVRATNVFKREGIKRVRDLDRWSYAELMLLKNFGLRSMHDLSEVLIEALSRHIKLKDIPEPGDAPPDDGPPHLLEWVRQTLPRMDGRSREILTGRIGLDGPPKTRASIAADYRLTKERIRQIERQTIDQILKKEPWAAAFRRRISKLVDTRQEPLALADLEAADDWFAETGDRPECLSFLIRALCRNRIGVVAIGGTKYATRARLGSWEKMVQRARAVLRDAAAARKTRAKCRRAVARLLPARGRAFSDMLWAEASLDCHFRGDGDGAVLVAYGHYAEQYVRFILEGSPVALRADDIAAQALEMSGRRINHAQIRSLTAKWLLTLGPGLYGLPNHVSLSQDNMRKAARAAERLVGGDPKRRWHVSELLAELRKTHPRLGERLDSYLLGASLQLKSNLTRLGVLVWTGPTSGPPRANRPE